MNLDNQIVQRHKITGELFKRIHPDYNQDYLVGNHGTVLSIRTGKPLTPSVSRIGYSQLVLLTADGQKKGVNPHRIVALTWLPNPENKPDVNHKDRNKLNNRLENLEWMTRKENVQHSYDIGRKAPRGEAAGGSKLKEADIPIIRKRYEAGEQKTKIGKDYGVNYQTITAIVERRTWKHIE